MRLEDRDPAYLWDMLEAARTLSELPAGLSVATYLADRKTQLAVERAIEILGEAARRVSPTVQQAHPTPVAGASSAVCRGCLIRGAALSVGSFGDLAAGSRRVVVGRRATWRRRR